MKLEDVIKRGTTAGKPAATAVPTGTLYYDTDLSQMERSNGTTWDVVEGTGSADAILDTIVNAKGDLIAATANDTVTRLAVGTNGQVLTANSAQATGLEWAAAAGGLTQEQVEDAVAALAVAGTNMTITYNDAVPSLTFDAAGSSGAPSTAKYVTTASDGTLSAEVVIPGQAASADREDIFGGGTTTSATNEEFDSGADPFTWAPSAPATHDVNTTALSHLYLKATDSIGERTGLKAWAPGSGAFDVRCKLTAGAIYASTGTGISTGLHIVDSGATNGFNLSLSVDFTNARYKLVGFTIASGTYTQRGVDWPRYGNQVYLRITRDGSNNVSFWWSDNGILWQLIATQSHTVTVAKMGVRFFCNVASITWESALDWLRTDV